MAFEIVFQRLSADWEMRNMLAIHDVQYASVFE